MTLPVGAPVWVVLGPEPQDVTPGVVVSDKDRLMLVRFNSGAELKVDRSLLATSFPRVGPGVRNTDPETSWLAAQRDTLREHHWLVLKALNDNPEGLIDHELEDLTGLQQDSAGKRRGELKALGLVDRTNQKRTTPRGRLAIVWQITDRGRLIVEARKAA